MNAQEFFEVVGREPEQDDLARANCEKAGQVGHKSCGICSICGKPNFICFGHEVTELDTLRAQNEKLREALRQINNSNNWWFKDGTYVWANKEDLHEWIEKRIEESK